MFSSLYWIAYDADMALHLQHCRTVLQGIHLRRARDYYLYFDRFAYDNINLKKNGRISRRYDLYLDGGQALNGYRPAGISKRLKNIMSRGLYANMPMTHLWQRRLFTLLRRLFANINVYEFACYNSWHSELLAVLRCSVADLLQYRQSGPTILWRALSNNSKVPSIDGETKPVQWPFMVIVPPLSSLPLPYLVLRCSDEVPALPSSDVLSPLQWQALVLALGQTELLLQGQNAYTKLEGLRQKISATALWQRDGIYLYWQGGYDVYNLLWQRAWQQGFLLPPNPWAPLVLSPVLLDGAAAKQLQTLLL